MLQSYSQIKKKTFDSCLFNFDKCIFRLLGTTFNYELLLKCLIGFLSWRINFWMFVLRLSLKIPFICHQNQSCRSTEEQQSCFIYSEWMNVTLPVVGYSKIHQNKTLLKHFSYIMEQHIMLTNFCILRSPVNHLCMRVNYFNFISRHYFKKNTLLPSAVQSTVITKKLRQLPQ